MTKHADNKIIGPMLLYALDLIEDDPSLLKNREQLIRHIRGNFPQLNDHSKCPNCDASMVQYEYRFDNLDARALLAMARVVQSKMEKGLGFTDANKVHMQTEISESYAAKSRTTQMSKLGLIAKVRRKLKNGKEVHDTQSGWLITRRGWEALSGKEVPEMVVVFRNEIVDRSMSVTTLTNALKDYPADRYDPKEWVHMAEYGRGSLL